MRADAEEGLLAALGHARYEVLPLDGVVDDVLANVPKSVKVTVTASPTKGLEPTLDVAERLAAHGYDVVPHLSARNRRLLRTSLRIGLGESVRFLRGHAGWLRRLAFRRYYSPDKLLARLAPVFSDPAARIAGIHVYTFNELERTERWRRRRLS